MARRLLVTGKYAKKNSITQNLSYILFASLREICEYIGYYNFYFLKIAELHHISMYPLSFAEAPPGWEALLAGSLS